MAAETRCHRARYHHYTRRDRRRHLLLLQGLDWRWECKGSSTEGRRWSKWALVSPPPGSTGLPPGWQEVMSAEHGRAVLLQRKHGRDGVAQAG